MSTCSKPGPVPTAFHIFNLQDSLRKQVMLEYREVWGVCLRSQCEEVAERQTVGTSEKCWDRAVIAYILRDLVLLIPGSYLAQENHLTNVDEVAAGGLL